MFLEGWRFRPRPIEWRFPQWRLGWTLYKNVVPWRWRGRGAPDDGNGHGVACVASRVLREDRKMIIPSDEVCQSRPGCGIIVWQKLRVRSAAIR